MKLSKAEALYCKVLDTQGNLTVAQIMDCGFSEGIAVEAIARFASVPARVLVNNAVRLLRENGVVTYMGKNIESYRME